MRPIPWVVCLFLPLALPVLTSAGRADERLEGIACRSVHLSYSAPVGVAFYNEVTVDRSAGGTYFMACGFRHGYFGMQELADGKKVVLFSVWDPGRQDDPGAVERDRRVGVVKQAKDVRVRRFGGEGTGGQCFFDYPWKVGDTCRFLVTARAEGKRTEYAAYFYPPAGKGWKHLVTFSTLAGGDLLRGYYSFVEDFRRNRISATQERVALFGPGWVRTADGKWVALTRARFTADRNPVTNINAGLRGGRFFLATGGKTVNNGTKLGEGIDLPAAERKPPADFPPTLLAPSKKGER